MDCDGVIWRGNVPIEGAIEILKKLEQIGLHIGFVTNNSSLSRQGFRRKFEVLGFNPSNYTIINSAYGAAAYLKNRNYNRIFMIGEVGLREELELQDIVVVEEYEPHLQGVCIGWDRNLTYHKLADAMRVIVNDKGLFVGTNSDNSFPLEDTLIPGTGSIIAALSNACGKEPDVIIGKPSRFLIDITLSEMGCTDPSEAVFIGDRLATDILAGINSGLETVLTRTGISDNHLKKTIIPTVVIDSIVDILTVIES